MHIISGLKKRCLGPATAGEAATGEAHSMFAAKKRTAKELREAEKQAGEEHQRDYCENFSTATAKKEPMLSLN
jgi:hypothetical protein